jgi:hypothetical protein
VEHVFTTEPGFKMRLLKRIGSDDFVLTNEYVNNDDIPPYAILSHTWGKDDEEVTFEDLQTGDGKNKTGYKKIQFCGEKAAKDNLQYFWIDTCCIKKSSDAELSEAINCMFRWYGNAAKCYVYLYDVETDDHDRTNISTWESAFRKSRWFTRGWTLQELIAPESVEFFTHQGILLGDKRSLEQQIQEITQVPKEAFQGSPLSEFSIEQRMLWAKNRKTKREEDKAYSLLGIFNVFMPLIYGEGEENAFRRLRKEISVLEG